MPTLTLLVKKPFTQQGRDLGIERIIFTLRLHVPLRGCLQSK